LGKPNWETNIGKPILGKPQWKISCGKKIHSGESAVERKSTEDDPQMKFHSG